MTKSIHIIRTGPIPAAEADRYDRVRTLVEAEFPPLGQRYRLTKLLPGANVPGEPATAMVVGDSFVSNGLEEGQTNLFRFAGPYGVVHVYGEQILEHFEVIRPRSTRTKFVAVDTRQWHKIIPCGTEAEAKMFAEILQADLVRTGEQGIVVDNWDFGHEGRDLTVRSARPLGNADVDRLLQQVKGIRMALEWALTQ